MYAFSLDRCQLCFKEQYIMNANMVIFQGITFIHTKILIVIIKVNEIQSENLDPKYLSSSNTELLKCHYWVVVSGGMAWMKEDRARGK